MPNTRESLAALAAIANLFPQEQSLTIGDLIGLDTQMRNQKRLDQQAQLQQLASQEALTQGAYGRTMGDKQFGLDEQRVMDAAMAQMAQQQMQQQALGQAGERIAMEQQLSPAKVGYYETGAQANLARMRAEEEKNALMNMYLQRAFQQQGGGPLTGGMGGPLTDVQQGQQAFYNQVFQPQM